MANIYVSSGTSFSATINITYPAGSTCTVFNYKKTWTAPNTNGSWTFKANEVGIYTVKAVSGDKSREKEVIITTEGQVATVELVYSLDIITQGTLPVVDTDVKITTSSGSGQGTAYQLSLDSSDGGIIFKALTTSTANNPTLWYHSAINFKDYTTLKLKLLGVKHRDNFPICFGVSASLTNRENDTTTNFAIASKNSTNLNAATPPINLSLDLSSIKDDTKYWVGLSIVGSSTINDSTYSHGGLKIASFQLV